MQTVGEQALRKRFQELSRRADSRGIMLFTDFLSLYEQELLRSTKDMSSGVRLRLEGGYEQAERRIAVFVPEVLEDVEINLPFSRLAIQNRNLNYAENLSHRDYLGALVHLGIERNRFGDILLFPDQKEYQAVVFLDTRIASVALEELTRVKHTQVRCFLLEDSGFSYTPAYEEISGSVSSIRLDALISLAFHTSRSSLSNLIPSGKVFLNGRLVTQNHQAVKEGDLVSVRGYGKFSFGAAMEKSRKGRIFVKIKKYI